MRGHGSSAGIHECAGFGRSRPAACTTPKCVRTAGTHTPRAARRRRRRSRRSRSLSQVPESRSVRSFCILTVHHLSRHALVTRPSMQVDPRRGTPAGPAGVPDRAAQTRASPGVSPAAARSHTTDGIRVHVRTIITRPCAHGAKCTCVMIQHTRVWWRRLPPLWRSAAHRQADTEAER